MANHGYAASLVTTMARIQASIDKNSAELIPKYTPTADILSQNVWGMSQRTWFNAEVTPCHHVMK